MPEHSFASHSIISVVAGTGVLVLAFLLIQAGRIWYQPRFAVPLLFGAMLAGLGLLFKIEHWAGTNWLLTAGAIFVGISYLNWFVFKAAKTLLSYLKLALMLSLSSYFLALAWWQPGVQVAAVSGRLFFWAVALLYVYQRWIRRPVPESDE